jgi:hypothetical protein
LIGNFWERSKGFFGADEEIYFNGNLSIFLNRKTLRNWLKILTKLFFKKILNFFLKKF